MAVKIDPCLFLIMKTKIQKVVEMKRNVCLLLSSYLNSSITLARKGTKATYGWDNRFLPAGPEKKSGWREGLVWFRTKSDMERQTILHKCEQIFQTSNHEKSDYCNKTRPIPISLYFSGQNFSHKTFRGLNYPFSLAISYFLKKN